MDPSRIETVRHQLLALHKAIIDAERIDVERIEGRLTGNQMLDRLLTDTRFAWLYPLTELIVRLDELLEADAGDVVDAHFALTVRLLTYEGDPDPFRTEYARLLHQSPEVTMAHASVMRALTGSSR